MEPLIFLAKKKIMGNDIETEYKVGSITALSILITLLLLIFQIFVCIPTSVVSVLLVGRVIPKSHGDLATLTTFFLSEFLVIGGIILYVRKKYTPFGVIDYSEDGEIHFFVFNEKYLEYLFGIGAVVGILWSFVLGSPPDFIKYFLIVLNGFAVLFFTIFFVVRLVITYVFSLRTLAIIILLCMSIWISIK